MFFPNQCEIGVIFILYSFSLNKYPSILLILVQAKSLIIVVKDALI